MGEIASAAGAAIVSCVALFQATDTASNVKLVRTDGTPAGTVAIFNQPDYHFVAYGFTNVNGKVIFGNTSNAAGTELWATDGRASGTKLLKDIYYGSFDNGYNSNPGLSAWRSGRFEVVGSRAVFTAEDYANGREPWASDGTNAGTKLVKNHAVGAKDGITTNGYLGGNGKFAMYVAADSVAGSSLWATDGTPSGTRLLMNLGYKSTSPRMGQLGSSKMLFGQTYNSELWSTDGTAAGTKLVKSFGSRDAIDNISWLPNRSFALLSVFTAGSGYELWITDGTTAGTKLLKEIMLYKDGSYPTSYREVGNQVIFTAHSDGHGRELWVTDGTTKNTKLLKELNASTTGTHFYNFTAHKGKVYFWAKADLPMKRSYAYVTDGTSAGTKKLSDFAITSQQNGNYAGFVSLGDRLVYLGATIDTPSDIELWETTETFNGQKKLTNWIQSMDKTTPAMMRAVEVPSLDGKNRPCPK